jgi:hypothetical protein
MKHKDTLAKILALIGTILVWFPILAMVVTSSLFTIRSEMFRMDYLIPAEIAPVPLVGSLLLWWAAFRANYKKGSIGWGMLAAAVFLVGSQVLAVVTGLASGKIAEGGWQMSVVMGGLIAYDLAFVWIGIAGIQLTSELIRRNRQAAISPQ